MYIKDIRLIPLVGSTPDGSWQDDAPEDNIHTLVEVITDEGVVGLGSVFTSSATGAGNETTITSFWNTLAHHGMLIVPVDYAGAQELFDISELRGGSPYGASTYAGGDGSRQPSDKALSIARYQGEKVARLATALSL